MEQRFDFTKVKRVVKKRKKWLILPFFSIFTMMTVISLALPDFFRSTVVISVENPQVTPELVNSTAGGYTDQRIQSLTQEITSRTRVLNLVARFDLLPVKREKVSADELVEMVQKRIHVEPIDAEIKKETRDRPILLTIAFKLSYEDEDPVKAQAVTNEISSYFMSKNIEAREKQAKTTSKFLRDQLAQVKSRVDELEARLALYREVHLEELPEFTIVHMQRLDRLNGDLRSLKMQIRSMEEQRSVIKGKLASLDPWSSDKVLSFEERLQQARLERMTLIAKYKETSPPVEAIDRQIASLEEKIRERVLNIQELNSFQERLAKLNSELAKLKQRKTVNKSTIGNKIKEIEAVSEKIASLQAKIGTPRTPIEKSTNLGYVALKTDMDKIEVSISTASAERAGIEKQIQEVYGKLYKMPQASKEYNEIMTDCQNAKTHYSQVQQKLSAAQIAQGLEEEQLGETFQIIEPAFLPEKPVRPNRPAIMVVGVILALGVSIGCMWAVEFSDKSIRGCSMMEDLSGMKVWSVIPKIVTEEDKVRASRKKMVLVSCSLIGFGVALAVFHFFLIDLNVFWAKLDRFVLKKVPF